MVLKRAAQEHDEEFASCERGFTAGPFMVRAADTDAATDGRNTEELSLPANPRNSGMNIEENKTFVPCW